MTGRAGHAWQGSRACTFMCLRGRKKMRPLSLNTLGFCQLNSDMLELCLRAFEVMVFSQQALFILLWSEATIGLDPVPMMTSSATALITKLAC